MLTNGHFIVIDMAVRALGDPSIRRWQDTLVLGAFREDTGYVAGLEIVYPYLSVTHFYRPGLPGGLIPFLTPGPRLRANHFFRRAVAHRRRGREAAAFLELGRAFHILIDMACPTHAQRAIHLSDPYEWYVDSHQAELRALRVPAVPEAAKVSDLVESLALVAQAFPADRTHHAWGWLMWRCGVYEKMDRDTVAAQARALIPMAAGHGVALLQLFLREAAVAAAA